MRVSLKMFAIDMLSFFICYLIIVLTLGAQGSTKGCERDKFSCNDGECIDKMQWCDSVKDCSDGSDEQYCKRMKDEYDFNPNKCTMNLFKCHNGRCIPWSGKCDGINTCGDGSDEKDCTMASKVSYHAKTENHLQMPNTTSFSNISHEGNSVNIIQNYEESTDDYSYISNTFVFKDEIDKALTWLLSERKDDYSWGDDTERAIVALSLAKGLNLSSLEGMLMIKQFHIRLSIALARNNTNTIDLSDLALYINALQASCDDPRNFYGFDLVSKLRQRVDIEHCKGRFVVPSVYLTLCMNNATTRHDVQVLQNKFLNSHKLIKKKGLQALALLATICIQMNKNYPPEFLVNLRNELIQNIGERLAGNMYEVALISQAFHEAELSSEFWNNDIALNFIASHQDKTNGSFGNILATYYAVPTLAGESLLSLGKNCFKLVSNELTPLEVLKNPNKGVYVSYGIYYGYPLEMSHAMILKVSPGTTFFDIMRLAQERNLNYRFKLDESKDRPIVYSIGGVPNDAEKGIFWKLYLRVNPQKLVMPGNITALDVDIRKLIPKGGEDIIFWFKPL